MNYKTHNQKKINADDTYRQGEIITTYDKLVAAFGEPTISDEYKVDAEWVVEIYPENEKEPVIATIYNWKNGHNYLGAEGWDTEEITHWHIGGHKSIITEYVKYILDNVHIDYVNTDEVFDEDFDDNEYDVIAVINDDDFDEDLFDLVILKNNNETELFHLFKGDNRTIKSIDIINQILIDNGFENLTYDYDEFGDNESEISHFMSNYEKALKNTSLSIEWYGDIEPE